MGGFSELIKNFDKTRDYVRDFFIYGFKVRGDFSRRSARTYDDEKRRVECWLGDFLHYDDSVMGRQTSISVDSGTVSENPFYQAYYSKSFTDNDIKLHFFLLDALADGKSHSLKEITEILDRDYEIIFDVQTVRNKLKEYAGEGIIISERKGKTSYFKISSDLAGDFLNETEGLCDAVKFFSETQEFGVVGNSILKSAGMKNDIFVTKHNYIVHTLEDDILPEIIKAIDEKRYVSFRTFSAKNNMNNAELGRENQLVPMQIFSSVQTGRRYLAGYVPEFKRFNAFRLDFIRQVSSGGICCDYDEIYEKFCKNINRCFGVSFGMRSETGSVKPLKLTFLIDEQSESFVANRLRREKRSGVLEKTGENIYTLTIDAFDPNEAMHWAKTFVGRIISVEGGNEHIIGRFYRDIARMYRIYGGETDDIQ